MSDQEVEEEEVVSAVTEDPPAVKEEPAAVKEEPKAKKIGRPRLTSEAALEQKKKASNAAKEKYDAIRNAEMKAHVASVMEEMDKKIQKDYMKKENHKRKHSSNTSEDESESIEVSKRHSISKGETAAETSSLSAESSSTEKTPPSKPFNRFSKYC